MTMQLAATVARTGFETALPVAVDTNYAAAVALDADGNVLAQSKTVRV